MIQEIQDMYCIAGWSPGCLGEFQALDAPGSDADAVAGRLVALLIVVQRNGISVFLEICVLSLHQITIHPAHIVMRHTLSRCPCSLLVLKKIEDLYSWKMQQLHRKA